MTDKGDEEGEEIDLCPPTEEQRSTPSLEEEPYEGEPYEGEPRSAHGGPVLCAPPTPPFPAPQSALSYNLPWRTLDLAKPLESLLRCS